MGGNIGIIGLGIMGGAIAHNLVRNGFAVCGYDVDPEACREASAAGAMVVDSVEAVGRARDLILTSLPSFSAASAVMSELVSAAAPATVIAELSTFSLEEKLALCDQAASTGLILVDCPLSGTGAQARTGDLVVYASGLSSGISRMEPVFAGFARRHFNLGAFGNGTKFKFIANHLVAIHNVATAEAMVMAMKAGLDLRMVVEVIGAGAGTSRVFEMRAPLMAVNRFKPATMELKTWSKDMAAIAGFASKVGAPTPLFDATTALYQAARDIGLGDEDTAAVCVVLERMAGLERE
jgi:3-hydroxyisobutyrate dehydrogenase-like beta-hydroxyacid dehydrogenase